MFFLKECHEKREKGKGIPATGVAKEIGEKWAAMSEKEKQPYELLQAKDKDRHEKEMADLKKNGFFVNKDGVKSTDLVYKAPKKPVRKAKS